MRFFTRSLCTDQLETSRSTPSPHPLSTRAFEILNASAKIPAEFWGGRGGGGRGVESLKRTRDLWWSLFWCLNTWPAWSSSGMCRSQTRRRVFLTMSNYHINWENFFFLCVSHGTCCTSLFAQTWIKNSFGLGPHFCQQNKHILLKKMVIRTSCCLLDGHRLRTKNCVALCKEFWRLSDLKRNILLRNASRPKKVAKRTKVRKFSVHFTATICIWFRNHSIAHSKALCVGMFQRKFSQSILTSHSCQPLSSYAGRQVVFTGLWAKKEVLLICSRNINRLA